MPETTTKSFDVLSRDLNVYQHHILEASAGTGKTFSIENLVVRLLIESERALELPQILVVTFTRAATRELRQRIRANIEATLSLLATDEIACPDFVAAIKEQGQEEVIKAKRRLEIALGTYDEAQIFTIHGFCARMLRDCLEGAPMPSQGQENAGLSASLVRQLIQDVFRTEVLSSECSPSQLKLLLNSHKGDDALLQNALAKVATRTAPISPVPTFTEHLKSFQAAMGRLKEQFPWSADRILELYTRLQGGYKQLDKEPVALTEAKVGHFALLYAKDQWSDEDFDRLICDDLVLPKALDPSQRSKRSSSKALVPTPDENQFLEALGKELLPIVTKARNVKYIFAWLARICQEFVQRYVAEEGIAGSDQILAQMAEAVNEGPFRQRVASRYQFAIVDEFQDTDPSQWQILQKLFLQESPVYVALVGDPKQAIYSFRQADVYTYMQAVSSFARQHHASLDTNYRSCSALVEGVNHLFNAEDNPNLLIMPALDKTLTFRPAQASSKAQKCSIEDGRGAIHLFIARGKGARANANWPTEVMVTTYVLPFLASEIVRLTEGGRAYRDIAILTRDHREASQALDFLRSHRIPAILERSGSVTASPALDGLMELIHAVLHPWDNAALLQLLGGRLLCFNESEAKEWILQPSQITLVYGLRDILRERGISTFMEAFLLSRWTADGRTVMERLLTWEGGTELYRDLRQLTEILAEQHHLPTGKLEQALHELRIADDEDSYKIRSDASEDAVRILTIYASKGLEYPIVFATGLKKRSHSDEKLVPDPSGNGNYVVAEQQGRALDAYLYEMDAEKVRLAYVAMTRAKERLYLPLLLEDDSKIALGEASALELVLGGLGQPSMSRKDLYERIRTFSEHSLTSFLDAKVSSQCISYEILHQSPAIPEHLAVHAPPLLVEPPVVIVPGAPSWMHSFTSLSGHPQDEREAVPLEGCPRDFSARVKNAYTLPAGSELGVLVHAILEKMPLDLIYSVKSPLELLAHIEGWIEATPFFEWKEAIANMVFSAFKTPITLGSHLVSLCELNPRSLFREMEFLFAQDPDSFAVGEGFLKGFVDLVFAHEGQYYIVDWKTNWLGPKQECYNQTSLQSAMRRGSYGLQASIYAEALERYLRCFEHKPFKECFGGIYYLFLRGMTPHTPNSGVISINPVEVALCQG